MKKQFFLRLAAAQAFALGLAVSAHAALPTEVGVSVSTAKTDLLEAIGLVMAAMVAVWGLRKLGQKMGWL
jgi:hypothetical protein